MRNWNAELVTIQPGLCPEPRQRAFAVRNIKSASFRAPIGAPTCAFDLLCALNSYRSPNGAHFGAYNPRTLFMPISFPLEPARLTILARRSAADIVSSVHDELRKKMQICMV